jgi:hypothetical protein
MDMRVRVCVCVRGLLNGIVLSVIAERRSESGYFASQYKRAPICILSLVVRGVVHKFHVLRCKSLRLWATLINFD